MQDSDKRVGSKTLLKYAVGTVIVVGFFTFLAVVGEVLQRRETEIKRLAELDRVTLWNIVREVDTLCDELGRVPANQEELETLMGKPLPHTHRYTQPMKMYYDRMGDNSYVLTSFSTSGKRHYTSDNPEAGWKKME